MKLPLTITRGSGNTFRDHECPNADALQCKAILAASIIKSLDTQNLTIQAAHERTHIPAIEFSRIRNANLTGFTTDHLTSILRILTAVAENPL